MPNAPTPQPDPTPEPEPHGVPTGRAMHIVYICAIAATVVGLYFGIRYKPTDASPIERAAPTHIDHPDTHRADAQPAIRYSEIHRGSLGPNADWHTQLTAGLTLEQQWALVQPGTEEDKRRDLAARALRRAYNGAPPTIPHPIDPVNVKSCIACHSPTGTRVGETIARPMPHPAYASCTQCHVPQNPINPEEMRWLDNSFQGLPAPTRGERAWLGAPPTIPHSTWMRSNCSSCHGPNGANGLQSSHPWRTSCTQCHAPSAELDRQPGSGTLESMFLNSGLPLRPTSPDHD